MGVHVDDHVLLERVALCCQEQHLDGVLVLGDDAVDDQLEKALIGQD